MGCSTSPGHCVGMDSKETRLRKAIEDAPIMNDAGEPIPVTASIGVAVWTPSEPLASLVSRADRAMYSAKSSGRNRVVVLEDVPGAAPAANVA